MSDEPEGENPWWITDEENTEVATSPELWRPIARAVGGFDLDPAAGCEPTQIADERYTPEDDGLSSPWHGWVWLNPPYDAKKAWYRRLWRFIESGDIEGAVAVAAGTTSSEWFQEYLSTADVICFLEDRDVYLDEGDSPSFATFLGVWNPTEELLDVLEGLGTCMFSSADTEQRTLSIVDEVPKKTQPDDPYAGVGN